MVHPHVCHVGGGRMWEASVRHHTAFSKWLPECLHSLSVIPQLIPEQVFQENDFFFFYKFKAFLDKPLCVFISYCWFMTSGHL